MQIIENHISSCRSPFYQSQNLPVGVATFLGQWYQFWLHQPPRVCKPLALDPWNIVESCAAAEVVTWCTAGTRIISRLSQAVSTFTFFQLVSSDNDHPPTDCTNGACMVTLWYVRGYCVSHIWLIQCECSIPNQLVHGQYYANARLLLR